MVKAKKNQHATVEEPPGIIEIRVSGFKSMAEKQSIEIRPLTLLAGANSSGKSSMMQPLLLLKQTLEAPYDPGALLLNGPHVKFMSVEQMLTKCGRQRPHNKLVFGIEADDLGELRVEFARNSRKQLDIVFQTATSSSGVTQLE